MSSSGRRDEGVRKEVAVEEWSGSMPLRPRVPDAWPSPSVTLQALSLSRWAQNGSDTHLPHLTVHLPTGAGGEQADTVRLMGRM